MPDGSVRSRRVLGWTGAGLVVALVAAGGTYVVQSAAADNTIYGHYRTATAATGSVSSHVTLTGTVQRVHQASVAFPVSGTVASVDVVVGQHVAAGQRLASLDPTALDVDLVSARATLAAAQAQLVSAQDGTTSGSSSDGGETVRSSSSTRSALGAVAAQAGSTSSASHGADQGSSSSGSTSSSSRGHTSQPSAAMKSLSATASRLQGQVKALMSASSAEQRVCAPFLTGGGPPPGRSPALGHSPTSSPSQSPSSTSASSTSAPASPTPTPTSTSSSPTGTSTPTTTATPTATDTVTVTVTASPTASQDPKGLAQCLAEVRTLSTSLTSVGRTVTALEQQVRKASSGATSAGAKSSGGTPGASSTASAREPSSGSSSAAADPSSPAGDTSSAAGTHGASSGSAVAQLQSSIAQDQFAVTQATAAKAQGTLVAPISGTIASVGLSKGASAGSSDTVTIVGAGAAQVTVDATLAQLPHLAQGQRATVSVPGANGTVDGYVSNVGILANSDGTYPVTILVGSAPGALLSGVDAQTWVTTTSVSDVVTVPASALQMVATNRATVTVLANGKATTQIVTVGAIGGGMAQVIGLKAGATVTLADLQEALPSSSSGNGNALTGGSAFGGGVRRFTG